MARSEREFNGRVFLRCGRSSEESLKSPKKSGDLCLVADLTGNRPTQVKIGRVDNLENEPFMGKRDHWQPVNPPTSATRQPKVANATDRLPAFDRNGCRPNNPGDRS